MSILPGCSHSLAESLAKVSWEMLGAGRGGAAGGGGGGGAPGPVAERWHPVHQALDSSRSSIETKPNQMGKEKEPESNCRSLPRQQSREVCC